MIFGIYEYCAPQRQGKSTLMVADLVTKVLPEFNPDDVYANFRIFIPGVHCMTNAQLINTVLKMKTDKVRHKVIMFDEVGQELTARGFKDPQQTKLVNFCWQMPKRDIILMYCSNPGNSADIIMRDATWQSIITQYHHGPTRQDDYITASVIHNYDLIIQRGITIHGLVAVQALFNTWEPIE